jgi:hypothetical protein
MKDSTKNFIFLSVIFFCIALFLYYYKRKTVLALSEYGTYEAPFQSDCNTKNNLCSEFGTQNMYEDCIPNPVTGFGCLDVNKNQTYATKVTQTTCVPQCRSRVLNLTEDDNLKYIRNFDGKDLNLLNIKCDDGSFTTYTTKTYTCVSHDGSGISNCFYTCGSDSTISLPSFDASIYPKELINGELTPVCYDENGKNLFEETNIDLSNICYSHSLEPDEPPVPVFDISKFKSPDRCFYQGKQVLNGKQVELQLGEVMNIYVPAKNGISKCYKYGIIDDSLENTTISASGDIQSNKFSTIEEQSLTTGTNVVSFKECKSDSADKVFINNCLINSPKKGYSNLFTPGYYSKPLYCVPSLSSKETLVLQTNPTKGDLYLSNDTLLGNTDQTIKVFDDIDRSLFKFTVFGSFDTSYYASRNPGNLLDETYLNFPGSYEDVLKQYSNLLVFDYFQNPIFTYQKDIVSNNFKDSFFLPVSFCDTTGLNITTSDQFTRNKSSPIFYTQNVFNTVPNFIYTEIIKYFKTSAGGAQYIKDLFHDSNTYDDFPSSEYLDNFINGRYTSSNIFVQGSITNGFSLFACKFEYGKNYNYDGCNSIGSVRNFDYYNCKPGVQFFRYNGTRKELLFFEIIKVEGSSTSPENYLDLKRIYFPTGNIEVPPYSPELDALKLPGLVYFSYDTTGTKKFYYYDYPLTSSQILTSYLIDSIDPFLATQETSFAQNFFIQKTTNVFDSILENENNLPVIFSDLGYSSLECAQECVYFDNFDQEKDINEKYFFGNILNKLVSISYTDLPGDDFLFKTKNYLGLKHVPCNSNTEDTIPLTLRGFYSDCGSVSDDNYYTQETIFFPIRANTGEFFGDIKCDAFDFYNLMNPSLPSSPPPQTLTNFEVSNILYYIIVPYDAPFQNPVVVFKYLDAVFGKDTYSKSNMAFFAFNYITSNIANVYPLQGLKCKIYAVFGNGYYGKLCFDTTDGRQVACKQSVVPDYNYMANITTINQHFKAYTRSANPYAGQAQIPTTNLPHNTPDFPGYKTYFAKEKFDFKEDLLTKILSSNTILDSTLSDLFIISNFSSTIAPDDLLQAVFVGFVYESSMWFYDTTGDQYDTLVSTPNLAGVPLNYPFPYRSWHGERYRLQQTNLPISQSSPSNPNFASLPDISQFYITGLIDTLSRTETVRVCSSNEAGEYIGLEKLDINMIAPLEVFNGDDSQTTNTVTKVINNTRENRLQDYGYPNCGKFFQKTVVITT